ncbi:MAG: Gfo/Idh/MocA family oxidoreductase [Candidatus Woesearchaeota archaeon]|jgi:predicted dehydrogenase|nr:Gfo/Idh/MocA family oxidoreductase [Candidatus Woesearchaeota archaeon]
MNRKIRVGIIGAGRMASKHIKAYKRLENVEIIGIAGRSEGKVSSLCEKSGVRKGYVDYKKLLSENELDVVSITTPAHTHCTIAIDCFLEGCHVLCEKPMAMNVNDAKEMNESSKKADKLLMIGFNLRFTDSFREVKSIIGKGVLGEVRLAWFRGSGNIQEKEWYLNKETSGGVTLESSIHKIDWLRWIVGSEVVEVYCQTIEDVLGHGLNNNEFMTMRFKNGALGVIGSSYSFNVLPDDIGVIGSRRCIGVRNGKVVLRDFRKGNSIMDRLKSYIPDFNLISDIKLLLNDSINKEVKHFIGCVVANKKPIIDGDCGVKSMEIAEAAMKSARTNKPVRL